MAVMVRGQKMPTAVCEQYPLLKRGSTSTSVLATAKIRQFFGMTIVVTPKNQKYVVKHINLG